MWEGDQPDPVESVGDFLSFPPFFRDLGAGVAGIPPVRIISVTLIRLLTAMLGTSTGKSNLEDSPEEF